MHIKSVSPQEACDLLTREEGYVYLDVRSTPEFSEGHPQGALNIPLHHAQPETGQMTPNPDFLTVVRANFSADAKLLLGCFSGGRSMMAAEMLGRAGYRNLLNVRCGFGGARDATGRVVEPGWASLGLPVERESRPGASYEPLLKKARP